MSSWVESSFTAEIYRPELWYPPHNETVSGELQLRWGMPAGASRFALQVATDENFLTKIIDTSGMIDTIFECTTLEGLTRYFWRVKAFGANIESQWHVRAFYTDTLSQQIVIQKKLPDRFKANIIASTKQETVLNYALPEQCRVSMSMYDIRGALVSKAIDKVQAAGEYSLKMAPQSSGTYYVIFTAGKYRYSGKVIQVR